jgi:hypothetical protein
MQKQKLFTSREGFDRVLVGIAITIFLIFSICSAYAIILNATNPVAWSMAAFFTLGLLLLLGYEKNMFPDIPKKKLPGAVVTWFFAWLFVAFLVSFLATLNIAHMAMAILFGTIVLLGSTYVLTDKGWNKIKTKMTRKINPFKKKKKKAKRIAGY